MEFTIRISGENSRQPFFTHFSLCGAAFWISKLHMKFSDKFLCLISTSIISSRMYNVSDIKTHVVVIKWKAKQISRCQEVTVYRCKK